MNCAEQATLRAHLDGELEEALSRQVEGHLASCTECRRRLDEIQEQREAVSRAMAGLGPSGEQTKFDAPTAYARLQTRAAAGASDAWLAALAAATNRRRLALAGLAAAALAFVVAITAFAPARTWAQKMLDMLRIREVTAIPVDSALLPASGNTNQTAQMIEKLISNDVTITLKPGQPQPASSAADASRLAGFTVRLLQNSGPPNHLSVMGAGAANLVIHRDRLDAIFQSAGRTDLQIPAAADGAMIAVYVPKSVRASYGNCPPSRRSGNVAPTSDQPPPDYSTCVELTQVPSPTVSVPAGLNLQQLAEIGLEFTGMTTDQAAAFCKTVDWTSTLAIPVPRDAASYSQVDVDGVKGVLLSGTRSGPRGYALIWVKYGVVYSLRGLGDPAGATALADSLGG